MVQRRIDKKIVPGGLEDLKKIHESKSFGELLTEEESSGAIGIYGLPRYRFKNLVPDEVLQIIDKDRSAEEVRQSNVGVEVKGPDITVYVEDNRGMFVHGSLTDVVYMPEFRSRMEDALYLSNLFLQDCRKPEITEENRFKQYPGQQYPGLRGNVYNKMMDRVVELARGRGYSKLLMHAEYYTSYRLAKRYGFEVYDQDLGGKKAKRKMDYIERWLNDHGVRSLRKRSWCILYNDKDPESDSRFQKEFGEDAKVVRLSDNKKMSWPQPLIVLDVEKKYRELQERSSEQP